MRALSHDRNFTLLWLGQTLSDVGSQVTTIALPLLVLVLTGSAAQAGLVGVARMIALPIVSLAAGALELLGLLIARHHGASPSAIGGVFAVMGVGGLLGAVVAGPARRRVSTRVGVLAELWFEPC